MAGISIDKLKQILREKQTPADVEPPVEAMRKSMEKLAFQAADDIETEPLTIAGRTAEWFERPAVRPSEQSSICMAEATW